MGGLKVGTAGLFRWQYSVKLTGTLTKTHINNLFRGSGTYVDLTSNTVDTLIVDEAHRLNEKSGLFFKGDNQIKEIINASKCSVFFIDEYQKVHIDDIGSVDEIKKRAKEANAEIFENELSSQFRCNGSDGYLAWLDNVLKDTIFRLNRPENRARILAGYCWEWEKKKRNDTGHYDIQIDDFKMSWNLGNSSTYAIDKESVNEVGCIHTSQGLEFDYVGVIIGKD